MLPSLMAPGESIGALTEEIIASLNAGELARRRFRDIAHIAGLVSRGFPGAAPEDERDAGLVGTLL